MNANNATLVIETPDGETMKAPITDFEVEHDTEHMGEGAAIVGTTLSVSTKGDLITTEEADE